MKTDHFPFEGRAASETLFCDCGWRMEHATKLDWWEHVDEATRLDQNDHNPVKPEVEPSGSLETPCR